MAFSLALAPHQERCHVQRHRAKHSNPRPTEASNRNRCSWTGVRRDHDGDHHSDQHQDHKGNAQYEPASSWRALSKQIPQAGTTSSGSHRYAPYLLPTRMVAAGPTDDLRSSNDPDSSIRAGPDASPVGADLTAVCCAHSGSSSYASQAGNPASRGGQHGYAAHASSVSPRNAVSSDGPARRRRLRTSRPGPT